MNSAAAQLVSTLGQHPPERAADPVRQPAHEPIQQSVHRHGPGRGDHRRGHLRPAVRHARGLQAGHPAGGGQLQLDHGRPQLQVRRGRPGGATTSARRTISSRYTFPTVAAYLAAKAGTDADAGTRRFSQTVGDPHFEMTSKLFSGFVQDDWRMARNLKVLYGVRYDLYVYPKANARRPVRVFAEVRYRQEQLRPAARRRVERSSETKRTGVAREHRHHVRPGDARRLHQRDRAERPAGAHLGQPEPAAAGAPAFPNTLSNLPAGYVLPAQNIFAIDSGLQDRRTPSRTTCSSNAGARQRPTRSRSALVYVKGYDLPVVNNINLINPIGTLADGRPIFSGTISADHAHGPAVQPDQRRANRSASRPTRRCTIQFASRSRAACSST